MRLGPGLDVGVKRTKTRSSSTNFGHFFDEPDAVATVVGRAWQILGLSPPDRGELGQWGGRHLQIGVNSAAMSADTQTRMLHRHSCGPRSFASTPPRGARMHIPPGGRSPAASTRFRMRTLLRGPRIGHRNAACMPWDCVAGTTRTPCSDTSSKNTANMLPRSAEGGANKCLEHARRVAARSMLAGACRE